MNNKWIEYAQRIQAIAQTGLSYTDNPYEIERYEELRSMSANMMAELTDISIEKINDIFIEQKGYQTPKIVVRGIVIRDEKMLLVREKVDKRWSVPGGWAEVGLSPSENIAKEIFEEAGIKTKVVRLLGLFGKRFAYNLSGLFHVTRMFFLCNIIDGQLSPGMETMDAGFFSPYDLPELSPSRNTEEQLILMYEHVKSGNPETLFD